jgi:hypothetical protein
MNVLLGASTLIDSTYSRNMGPLAGNPGINPNTTGLPGLGTSSDIVGALISYGLIACVAGIVISALVWAISHHSGNGRGSDGGKTGVLVACGGALLIGGADLLVTFFSAAGAALH